MKNYDCISQYLCKRNPSSKKERKERMEYYEACLQSIYSHKPGLEMERQHLLAQFPRATALQKLLVKSLGREGV